MPLIELGLLPLLVAACTSHVNRPQPTLAWSRVPLDTSDDLLEVKCTADDRVAVVGARDSVLMVTGSKTAPAPASSTFVGSHTSTRSGERAYRVSPDGRLMRSNDGGQHWNAGPRVEDPRWNPAAGHRSGSAKKASSSTTSASCLSKPKFGWTTPSSSSTQRPSPAARSRRGRGGAEVAIRWPPSPPATRSRSRGDGAGSRRCRR